MNPEKETALIHKAFSGYRTRLDTIPEEQFAITPPIGGWSYAEVYSHILKSNHGCTLAIADCVLKKGEPSKRGLNLLGNMMFLFGSYPPFPVKQPEYVAKNHPAEKMIKEEAYAMLTSFERNSEKLLKRVYSALPVYRQPHPVLGRLNATQWYKFIRIHSERHLAQLQRIKESFAAA